MATPDNNAKIIGRYKLIAEIGRGGMAIVYRAVDMSLQRKVAVKLLHPHLASHGESRARFHREAQAVARLKHDAVLEIYDYSGDEGNDVYIVMELIEGTTLRKLLEQRRGEPLIAEAAALVVRPVLSALAHAHSAGMIHRDVKPENILIGPDGAVKLSDFGIAHIAGMTEMTVTGQILGSPAYMSPEHVEMVELDARADIFSVGIVLYEMAVGRQPFAANSPHGVLKRIVEGRFDDPLLAEPSVGLPLARILRKCLATATGDRYATVEQLIEDVDAMLLEMGIDTPAEEQKAFFADSEGWSTTTKKTVIDRTLALGIQAKRRRRHADAAAHFNRVLTMDSGNEKAVRLVSGMERSRQIRRFLEISIVAFTVITAAVALGKMLLSEKPSTSIPPIADEPRASDEPSVPQERLSDNEPPDDEESDTFSPNAAPAAAPVATAGKKHRSRQASHKEDPPSLREVVFTPHPLSVEIIIDNEKPFPFGPAHRAKNLSVGNHKITFRPVDKDRFLEQTWTVDIPSGDGAFPFRGRLMWRPAQLLVRANVPASVTVPGRAASGANRTFKVDIKKGPSEQISVLISQEGYVPQTKQVTISAGELTSVDVKLVPTAAP